MELNGQTAVITGGSRGIGRAAAIRLAQEGAHVVISYVRGGEEAEKTAELCREYGVTAKAVRADVSVPEDCDRLFEEALSITGKLEILVNNAGITKDGLLLRMKEEDFDRVVRTGLYGTFYCMKRAAGIMLRQKYGRIISISSIVGLRGNAGQVNYAAAKAGIIGMTKSLAKELAAKGITVNAIAPGMIRTAMTEAMSPKAFEAMEASIPAGRIGEGTDVAQAVAFFADPQSGYTTGQVLAVDGALAV